MFPTRRVEPYSTITVWLGLFAAIGLLIAAIAGVLTGIPMGSAAILAIAGSGLTYAMTKAIRTFKTKDCE